MADLTPEGDPIDTQTIWLSFPDGDVAITADLTRLNAAFRRIEVLRRRKSRGDN